MINMNLEQFTNTLQTLKGTEEDYEIAISNLRNLNVDSIYILLLGKELVSSRRAEFMKAFPSVEWATGKDFTYKALYNECKRRKLDVQEIFTYLISTNIKDTILSTDTFGFVDDVKIKIKW